MPVTKNTWNINADGDWSTAADWSLATVPDSNNDVVINTTSIHTITHNGGNDTVNSLTVGNDHFVMNGGSLALVAGASFALDYQQFGGTLLGAGAVNITGAGNLLGGGAQGTLAFAIGGAIQIGNYSLGGSDTLTNNSTVNETAGITLGDATGVNAKIANAAAGAYTINGDYGVAQGAASASIANAGSFAKTAGSGTSFVDVNFTDTGTVSVASGSLEFRGPTDSFTGAISGAGQFALGGGSVSTLASGTSITAAAFGIYDSANVTLGENLTYAGTFYQGFGSVFNLNGHTLTLNGAADFYNQNFGTPTIDGSGTLATSAATTINSFVLGGSVNWSNSGVANQIAQLQVGDGGASAATLTNNASAQYNIAGDTNIEHGGAATSSIVNAGTLAKTAGSGTSFVDVNVVDTGTVAVASGLLEFRGASDSFAGTISGAGQFALGGGSVSTLASGTSITAAAFGLYDSASLTLGGDFTYGGNFTETFGTTINLAGRTLTLSGPVNLYNQNFGTPTINGSGTLATKGATTANVFTLGGSVNWVNTGVVTQNGQNQIGDGGSSAAKFTNQSGASFNIANDTNLVRGSAATSSFVNVGTFAKTGGSGSSVISVNVVDTGTISVASGTLEFTSANNSFGGAISGAGQFALGAGSVNTLAAGASVTVANFGLYDSANLTLGGNIAYAHNFSEGFSTTINLAGHTLSLSGAVNFYNQNFGTPTVNGSGTLATSGTTTINYFVLGGSVNWSNTGTISEIATLEIGDGSASAATFTNGAAGHFNFVNDSGITRGTAATSSFTNAGAFAKTGGTGKSVVGVNFNNSGSVEVMTGALDFAGAVTGAGTMKIDAGATLEVGSSVAAGTFNFASSNGVLQIDNVAAFNGSVTGFVSGDVLDLAGQSVASISYTGTKLTVNLTNNTTKTFNFASTLTALKAVADGSGGTDIIALPAPYALTTGTDLFAFASGANKVTATSATLTAGDALTGGSGVDNLALSGGGSFNLAALAALSFDTVTTVAGSNYTITAGNADIGTGQFTLNASGLTAADSLNFNASSATLGKFSLTGGVGADTIIGGGAQDFINGRGGLDTLTGGVGANTYVFSSALNAAVNDATITNFHVKSDNIDLAHTVFTALSAGALPASAFTIGTGATTASQRIIYNSGTGALLYDSDGSGGAAAVQFATLSTGLNLTASNIKVY
jgi:Ca2+-binding RTX toxin-like protein